MASTLEKEWAAVDDDEKIVMKADDREELLERLKAEGLFEGDFEIVALPKSHKSLFI